MKDLQNARDHREIPLDHVGVRDLRYPIVILDKSAGTQQTVARLSMSVDLPHHFRGTHMSRFIEVLEHHRGEVTMRTLPIILDELRRRLRAERARIEVRFPYFLQRAAPVSRSAALMDYDCWFIGEVAGWVGFSLMTARSAHSGGVNLLFADGHAAFVNDGIDLKVWRAWGTPNGGEPVADAE